MSIQIIREMPQIQQASPMIGRFQDSANHRFNLPRTPRCEDFKNIKTSIINQSRDMSIALS